MKTNDHNEKQQRPFFSPKTWTGGKNGKLLNTREGKGKPDGRRTKNKQNLQQQRSQTRRLKQKSITASSSASNSVDILSSVLFLTRTVRFLLSVRHSSIKAPVRPVRPSAGSTTALHFIFVNTFFTYPSSTLPTLKNLFCLLTMFSLTYPFPFRQHVTMKNLLFGLPTTYARYGVR